jgi:hypothetical protein
MAPKRNDARGRQRADLVRRGGRVVAIKSDGLFQPVTLAVVQDEGKGHLGSDRIEAILELGDDPEVAAAAAQAPEEIFVFPLAGGHDAAIGGDHLGRNEIVGAQAVLIAQPAQAAAQRQAGDTRRRDHAHGGGQSILLRRPVQVADGGTTPGASGACFGIYQDVFHQRQVDDQAAVDRTMTGDVVVAREVDRGDHILYADRASDERRVAVDHSVPHGACFIVAGVAGVDQVTSHIGVKFPNPCFA